MGQPSIWTVGRGPGHKLVTSGYSLLKVVGSDISRILVIIRAGGGGDSATASAFLIFRAPTNTNIMTITLTWTNLMQGILEKWNRQCRVRVPDSPPSAVQCSAVQCSAVQCTLDEGWYNQSIQTVK
jgi:hypothetical protein